MRKLVMLLLLSTAAHAADHNALIWVRPDLLGHTPAVNEKIPQRSIQQVLFADEPCALPLVDTRGMHKYFSQWDMPQRGAACWYETLSGVTVIWRDGGVSNVLADGIKLQFSYATLHDDGTATFLGNMRDFADSRSGNLLP